ncbi:MAG TPA: hypothetical protein VK837_10315 [Longimicrobiales bacterium]|nr:hypothetical protein [Longimicrobiales bacterium]
MDTHPTNGAVPDLIDALRAAKEASGELADSTLAGYRREHERPPAFEGADGQAYTVAVEVQACDGDARPFAAFFVFPRWAETGAGIMGHVESPDIAWGASAEEACAAAEAWTLFEIRGELDAAIERRAAAQAETPIGPEAEPC